MVRNLDWKLRMINNNNENWFMVAFEVKQKCRDVSIFRTVKN